MSGRLKPNAAYIEVRVDFEHRPDPSCRAQQPAQWLSGLDALKRRHFGRKVDLLLLDAFADPEAHETRDLGLLGGEQLLDGLVRVLDERLAEQDRKSTRLNSSH